MGRLSTARESLLRSARSVAAMPATSTLVNVYQRDRRFAGAVLAAGLAFRIFLTLLPLSLLLASFVGFSSGGDPNAMSRAVRQAGMAGAVAQIVSQTSKDSHDGRWLFLLVGLFLLVVAARAVEKALRLIHEVAWEGYPRGRVSPLGRALVPLGIVVMMLGGAISGLVAETLGRSAPFVELLVFLLALGVWFGMSLLLPHGEVPTRALLPGALFVAVAFAALHLVVAVYLPQRISHSSELYGALGAAAALMAILLIASRVMVASAVVNVVCWERGWVLGGRKPAPPGRLVPQG